ncbi:hypothetical protein VTH8203_04003 [Vibrio thalassae]|uniref:DUF2513 domain-containing protein n=1 Tax=Vibrio thalassae TaxID=1243014 RepID=A0A240ENY9_9VIBR|nr:DUF2513 domain-containing protein [Vibrio thalassae]SNX50344.1 hypothetical protein VTH8203_04003 [Vibrio thalassae]
MRIDVQYISSLLSVFLESDTAHITLSVLENAGVKIYTDDRKGLDEKFVFHAQLLVENGLVSDKDLRSDSLNTFGISYNKSGGTIVERDVRLTQQGHDFASALNNKEVLEKLKTELTNAPFRVLFDGSQKLLEHYLTKKLDALLA